MDFQREIICNGPSMKPTIMPGDKIETVELSFDKLRPGDIIVYNSPEDIRINIIHRIIKRSSNGLATRGDNNSKPDPYLVRPEHRPLKVIAVKRGSYIFAAGKHGMLLHRIRLCQRIFRIIRTRYLSLLTATLADTGILYPLGFFFKTEIREFKRPKGLELQLFIGKNRIGILRPQDDKWRIRFPWRFFIKPPER